MCPKDTPVKCLNSEVSQSVKCLQPMDDASAASAMVMETAPCCRCRAVSLLLLGCLYVCAVLARARTTIQAICQVKTRTGGFSK